MPLLVFPINRKSYVANSRNTEQYKTNLKEQNAKLLEVTTANTLLEFFTEISLNIYAHIFYVNDFTFFTKSYLQKFFMPMNTELQSPGYCSHSIVFYSVTAARIH